jgi:pimeloyl-ACP methyl ester carboxylesterase
MRIPTTLLPYSQTIRAGEARLHYYDAGKDNVPIVLIHGLGDEADTWRHMIAPLAAHHRVFAPDLPGFGRSDKPRRAYTVTFFARTIEALLRGLGIRKATLVGSSLGAAVAQRLALARPHLVERLVLIGGALPIEASRPPAPLWLFLTPGLGEAIYTSLRRSQDAAYATLRPYYANLDALPEADRAFLRERVWERVWSAGQRRAFLSALRWVSFERVARAAVFRNRLAHVAIPTDLIWGERDQITPRASGESMAQLLPNARFHLIAGSGHLPQQERPIELLDSLKFLP